MLKIIRMKTVVAAWFLCFFSFHSLAQHCPFDGSSAIVILLKDKTGKPITSPAVSVVLSEIDNPSADSCKYSKGLQQILFGTIETSLIKKYPNSWEMWARDMIKECNFNGHGYLTAVLGQAEESCIIDQGDDWKYIPRQYQIIIKKGDVVKKIIPTTDKNFYQLCTGAGSWGRIKPLEIILPD